MRPRPRVAAEANGAILEVPVHSRLLAPIRPMAAEAAARPAIAPAHRTAAAVRTAPLLPMAATTAETAACPAIAPARRPAAAVRTAPLLPMVATTAEAAVRLVIAPARRPAAAAGTAPLLPREAVVAAVPAAAAEAPTAGGARVPPPRYWDRSVVRYCVAHPRNTRRAASFGWAAVTLRSEPRRVRPSSGPARSESTPFRKAPGGPVAARQPWSGDTTTASLCSPAPGDGLQTIPY